MKNSTSAQAVRRRLATAAGALTLLAAGATQAATISFDPFNANLGSLDISAELTVTGTQAVFEFSNNSTGVASGSSVARIYFETGFSAAGVSGGLVTGGTGTSFSSSYPGPASVPAGNTIGWTGEFIAFGAVAAPRHNGLEVGESLTIAFDYTGTEAALVAAILDPNGHARIALHVLDCVGDNSCVASSRPVPIPAALPLLLSALAGLGFLRRR